MIPLNSTSQDVVRVPGWEHFSWLRHGFSSRAGGASTCYRGGDGDLNLGFTSEDDRANVRENRRHFLQAVTGDSSLKMVTARQVHGSTCVRVREGDLNSSVERACDPVEADGLMTADPGLMLSIMVADCVPVLIADVRRRVVGAFHAGWRGTVAEIVEKGVAAMASEMGAAPEQMVAAVGPSIRPCCYCVGPEVEAAFRGKLDYADPLFQKTPEGLRLDLAEANRIQLLRAGLPGKNITVLPECTACSRVEGLRKYFSHRAENGFTGRAMGMIGMMERSGGMHVEASRHPSG